MPPINLASCRDGGSGIGTDAFSRRAGQQRRVDRDRVYCRGSDADHGYGRRGDAEGRGRGTGRWTAAVIPIASGVGVWIATGHTDMRRGMNSLALLVQEALRRDPHGGDLYVFRGKSGKLIKILWHDGLGMSLYAKRLERGRFLWPSSADGVVTITPAQLAGACRNTRGVHRRRADRWDLNRWQGQRFGQRPRLVILCWAMGADDSLPEDVTTLQAMLRAERAARLAAEAEAQAGSLLIEKLKLTIKKLRHEQFGQSSERGALLDQLELQLADLEENAAQAETAAQMAAEKIAVPSFERRKPARRPLPEYLPRERLVYPVAATCPCCGDSRLRKIGEDVTETL